MKKICFLILCVAMTTQVFGQSGDYLILGGSRTAKLRIITVYATAHIVANDSILVGKVGESTEFSLDPVGEDAYLISVGEKYWVADTIQQQPVLKNATRTGDSLSVNGEKIPLPLFKFKKVYYEDYGIISTVQYMIEAITESSSLRVQVNDRDGVLILKPMPIEPVPYSSLHDISFFDIDIITGILPVSSSDAKVYATEGLLHIQAAVSGIVNIYDIRGSLVRTAAYPVGSSSHTLPSGFYIVKTEKETVKVYIP